MIGDETFFWHDYETFGRVPRSDRPVQFAGLRTDLALQPVGEPVMLYCQPAPDSLPDPEAVLLTGILPQHALRHGQPEHRFAQRILGELGRPGTIGVGYNSLRFDDEVTRYLFWRSLLDPYAREWREGCSRWDLLEVVRCAWALRPEGVQWPLHATGERAGQPSFRLGDLCAANGLAHEVAHDALSDVQATIALARLIRTQQPRLWDFCLRLRRKEAVLNEIGVDRPFVHVSGRYPVQQGCMAIVWPLGPHPVHRNELIVWDLAHDPRELEGLDAGTVRRRLFTPQRDLPEGERRLPIKTVHLNRAPIVIGALATVKPVAERFALDVSLAMAHARHAQALAPQLKRLWPEVFAGPPAAPGRRVDVDEDLYGGFLSDRDRRTLDRLRALSESQWASDRSGFDDPRLPELVFRYRARNLPQTLSVSEQERWQAHCVDRLHHGAGGARTLEAVQARIDELADDEALDEDRQALLEGLLDYIESIAPPFEPFCATG